MNSAVIQYDLLYPACQAIPRNLNCCYWEQENVALFVVAVGARLWGWMFACCVTWQWYGSSRLCAFHRP